MSGSCRVPFQDVREATPVVRECLEGPSWMSGRPARMSGSGRKALSAVRERSGSSLECPGVVRRLSQLSGRVS